MSTFKYFWTTNKINVAKKEKKLNTISLNVHSRRETVKRIVTWLLNIVLLS